MRLQSLSPALSSSERSQGTYCKGRACHPRVLAEFQLSSLHYACLTFLCWVSWMQWPRFSEVASALGCLGLRGFQPETLERGLVSEGAEHPPSEYQTLVRHLKLGPPNIEVSTVTKFLATILRAGFSQSRVLCKAVQLSPHCCHAHNSMDDLPLSTHLPIVPLACQLEGNSVPGGGREGQ